MKNNEYYLFLDDIRYPYVNVENMKDLEKEFHDFVSAYHYTKYESFKNEKWLIARNYHEFVNLIINKGVPKKVAFDHDLGIEHYKVLDPQKKDVDITIDYSSFQEKTGYDCVKWLCDYCQEHNIKFPEYYIHSMNTVGALNIKHYIENYKKHVENS